MKLAVIYQLVCDNSRGGDNNELLGFGRNIVRLLIASILFVKNITTQIDMR